MLTSRAKRNELKEDAGASTGTCTMNVRVREKNLTHMPSTRLRSGLICDVHESN